MTAKVCNDSEFHDRFHLALSRARRNRKLVLLLLIQIRMDMVNGAGESEGALSELAIKRIGTCLRSSDTVCPYYGQGLALLMEDVRDSAFVPSVIEKLNATLTHPIHLQGREIVLLPSYGASLYPIDGHAADELRQQAESALRRAGESPGAFKVSRDVENHGALERFELGKELHVAYRNNEFRVVYQPVFTVDQQRVSAVEAFIRWDHPERGALLPEDFLDQLEETGLIVPVGERVLRETCQFARTLLDEGHEGIRVCVNVSARQLTDPGFLLGVLDALYDTGLDASLLQLDFSEKTLTSIPDAAQRLLPDIRKVGIRVAMDHFGSGDSSLAELVRLPLSLIKIDRALVNRIVDDPVSNAISAGIFALAQGTGMDVAAVGVEASAQIGVLDEMGCKEIQGRFLADPLNDSELEPLLPN